MSEVVGTEWVGQLTGSARIVGENSLTTDWANRPLLNETNRFGVNGIDLGAHTEHNGRLYFFFGDVAVDGNPDAVCWTTDTIVHRNGGHLALGFDFRIPNDHQGATGDTGQWQWRFCANCHGLFFCPAGIPVGVCPAGDMHVPVGWIFVLPNDHQHANAATGQGDWRPCDKCSGLFFAPGADPSGTVCPAGGQHRVPPGSWIFYLPALQTGASEEHGQPEWRFCANCHGLFWNGDSIKGVCSGAGGGGFRLNAVLDSPGRFAPFTVDPPIGLLGSNETPTGAFSYDGRAYVFVWVGEQSSPARQPGSYLTSKADPGAVGTYRVEQLISPFDITTPTIRTSFNQIAAVCVDNAAFPGVFPESAGAGLVMFGGGYNVKLGDDAIHLAWSPLAANPGIGPLSMVYYTGDPAQPWSPEPNLAAPLVPRHGYTSVSATWLPGPERWILVYGTANPANEGGPANGPVMARLGRTPFELADTPDIDIFNPGREHAYGWLMHQPGLDRINPEVPPPEPPGSDDPGWAYGAHLLNRFIQWNPQGLIELYYLMSTASPYQVHLMHTTLRFG